MKCPACGYVHHAGVPNQIRTEPFILQAPGIVECPECRKAFHPFAFKQAKPELIRQEHCA